MAIHCEPVREQTNRIALSVRVHCMQWIAASSFVLLAMTKSCCNRTAHSHHSPPCHREGVSPWRSTVNQYANRQTRPPPSRHDGLPRLSLCSLLAMTRLICEFLIFPCLHPPCPDSTFYSYSIKRIIENNSNRRESNMPFDRLLTFII